MTTILRPLSISEVAYVKSSTLTTVKTILVGHLDYELFRKAILTCLNQHPLAKSTIKSEQGALVFMERLDLTEELEKTDPARTEEEMDQIYEDVINSGLNIEKALYRFVVTSLGAERQQLILTFHHAICDGTSLIRFYVNLLECYNLLSADSTVDYPALDVAPPIESYIPGTVSKLSDDEIVQTIQSEVDEEKPDNLWLSLTTQGEASKLPPRIRSFSSRLPPEISKQLVDKTRENGCTVTGVLGAALMYAIKRVTNREDQKCVLTCKYAVDLRARVAGDQHPNQLNCYVIAYNDFQSLDVGIDDDSYWTCAKDIGLSLKNYAESDRAFINLRALGIDKKPQNTHVSSVLSNIGRLDLDRITGQLVPERFSGQGVSMSPCIIITAMYYFDSLQLDYLYTTPWVADEKARAINEEIENILADIVN